MYIRVHTCVHTCVLDCCTLICIWPLCIAQKERAGIICVKNVRILATHIYSIGMQVIISVQNDIFACVQLNIVISGIGRV